MREREGREVPVDARGAPRRCGNPGDERQRHFAAFEVAIGDEKSETEAAGGGGEREGLGLICQISFHASESGHDQLDGARYGSADTY